MSCWRCVGILSIALAAFFVAVGPVTAASLPLNIDEPTNVERTGVPITIGIPFPKGALASAADMRVLTDKGVEIPLQARVISTWPDGSVKWVLLDFFADVPKGKGVRYQLEYGRGVKSNAAESGKVFLKERPDGGVEVTTGPLRFTVSGSADNLFDQVWLDSDGDGSFADNEKILAENPRRGPFADYAPAEGVLLSDRGQDFVDMPLGAHAPSVTCAKVSRAPVVDGRVHVEEWARGGSVDALVSADGKQVTANPTAVRVCQDARALYFAFECKDSDAAAVVGKQQWNIPENTRLFRQDCVEVHLSPCGRRKYTFVVDAGGHLYTQKRDGAGAAGNSWINTRDTGVEAKTFVGKGVWYAEIKIPFEALDWQGEKPAKAWRVNLVRRRSARGNAPQQDSFWVPAQGGFLSSERYGRLEGVDFDIARAAAAARVARPDPAAKLAEDKKWMDEYARLFTGGKLHRVTVEEAGPLHAVIRVDGRLNPEGPVISPYVMRIHAYAGKSFVNVEYTFINTEARPERYFVKSMGLRLPLSLSGTPTYTMGTEVVAKHAVEWSEVEYLDKQKILRGPADAVMTLLQDASEDFVVRRDSGDGSLAERLEEGCRAWGWADLSDGARGVTVAMKDFWQLCPNAVRVDGRRREIAALIWPEAAGLMDMRLYSDYKGHGTMSVRGQGAEGVARTQQVTFYFHRGGADEARSAQLAPELARPSIAFVTPEWYAQSGVLGDYLPWERKNWRTELPIMLSFEFLLKSQAACHWYGKWDYGDQQCFHRVGLGGWYFDVGRRAWENNETDTAGIWMFYYLRTGRRDFFDFGDAMARHITDVDTVHFQRRVGMPRVGGGSRHCVNHWGDGYIPYDHTFVLGYLLDYALTGYRQAYDTAQLAGRFCVNAGLSDNMNGDFLRGNSARSWQAAILYDFTPDGPARAAYKKMIDGFFVKLAAKRDWGPCPGGLVIDNLLTNFLAYRWAAERDERVKPILTAYERQTTRGLAAIKAGRARGYWGYPRGTNPAGLRSFALAYGFTGDPVFLRLGDEVIERFRGAGRITPTDIPQHLTMGKILDLMHKAGGYDMKEWDGLVWCWDVKPWPYFLPLLNKAAGAPQARRRVGSH